MPEFCFQIKKNKNKPKLHGPPGDFYHFGIIFSPARAPRVHPIVIPGYRIAKSNNHFFKRLPEMVSSPVALLPCAGRNWLAKSYKLGVNCDTWEAVSMSSPSLAIGLTSPCKSEISCENCTGDPLS